MRLAVCMPQVPFERGGTEIFADGLVQALREHGHETDLVTVPYKWYPGEKVLTQAFLWRLLDLDESVGRPIDAVIATKFPSYAVRHPRKVVWLLHQFRQAWDLDRTELGQFSESAEDRALRRKVLEFDSVALGEARKIFTTSSIVAGRLHDSTGLDADVLAQRLHEPVREDLGAAALERHLRHTNEQSHFRSSSSTRRESSSTRRSSASFTIRCSANAGSTYQRISLRSTRFAWNATQPFAPGRRSRGLSALTGQNRSARARIAAGSRASRSIARFSSS